MSGMIKVNSAKVVQFAEEISNENKKLKQQLEDSKASIDALSRIWTGDASQDTKKSFDDFSRDFFENYYNMLQNYVIYMKESVAQGYSITESGNVDLSSNFK